MQRLPNLVMAGGVIALPLSDRAAAGLVAALITGPAAECDRRRLADTLAHDPPLALWTACRAAQALTNPPRTLADLADWLAREAVRELVRPATDAPPHDAWPDLAAVSLGAAALAERIARAQGLDSHSAYLLGLLHAAAAWFATCASDLSSRSVEVLPIWLQGELSQIAATPGSRPSSAAECVAQALCLIGSAGAATCTAADVGFDFAAYCLQANAARRDWLEPGEPGLLSSLLHKLARLDQLSRKFDETLETEKLESLKELAQGAGHEINNPLANISARAQTLLPGEHDPERRRMLAAIHSQAVRAHEMIADLMLFARPPRPKLESIDLTALLRGLAGELSPQALQQQTELVFEGPDRPVSIRADKTQIAVAVRAVCVNALEALASGGRVVLALAESAPLDDTVQITVADNGPGISGDVRRHLFDPFYSGREAGRGLGFGLSKCWRIVTQHAGRVAVESTPGCGTRFTISLPKRSAS
jgi:signal transduction histidine kinase